MKKIINFLTEKFETNLLTIFLAVFIAQIIGDIIRHL